jgi:molybdenum cofactor guanylyltransferase
MNTLGVLLAGGQSSRMGTNKALLQLGDEQLISHMQHMMTNTTISKLIVSGPISITGTENLVDIHPEMGPLGGIYSVLAQLDMSAPSSASDEPRASDEPGAFSKPSAADKSKNNAIQTDSTEFDGVVFVPVDLPLMTSDTLNRLIEQGSTSKQACYFESSNLPLYLPIDKLITEFLAFKLTHKAKLSIGSLIAFCNAQAMQLDDQLELTNTNTPQEWHAVQELLMANQ